MISFRQRSLSFLKLSAAGLRGITK